MSPPHRKPREPTMVGFPGKPAVLRALKDAGTWTPRQLWNWARCNGGSEPTYAALHHYVERGKVSYEPNLWTFKHARPSYDPLASQVRGC